MQESDNFRGQIFGTAYPPHNTGRYSVIFFRLTKSRFGNFNHADLVQISHALFHSCRTPIYDADFLLPQPSNIIQCYFVYHYLVLYFHQLLTDLYDDISQPLRIVFEKSTVSRLMWVDYLYCFVSVKFSNF